MKRFIIPLLIIGASLSAINANAQIYIHARINLPVPPIPRFLLPPAPPAVVYQQPCAPAQSAYYNDYNETQVVVENPDYVYRERDGRRYYERSRENYHRDYYRHDDRRDYDRRDCERERDHDHEREYRHDNRRNW